MNRHALRSYARTHDVEGATDREQSKIKRETGHVNRQRRRKDRVVNRILRDPNNERLIEREAELEHVAAKQMGNAKTHKKRLNELKRQGLE